jgi:hypothetical protein
MGIFELMQHGYHAALCRCQYPQKSTDGTRFIASAAIMSTCSPLLTRR